MTDPTAQPYLAIDPGETSGWASFNSEGNCAQFGQVEGAVELYELLNLINPSTIICEDFILYQNKAAQQSGSKMFTSKLIGAMEYWCWDSEARFFLQPASIKPMGYKWAGLPVPTNHAQSHQYDAIVHGNYWLIQNRIKLRERLGQ